jgi:hypothetical protein
MKRYWAVGPDRPATASTGIGANRAASAFSGYNGKALYWENSGVMGSGALAPVGGPSRGPA